MRNARLFGILFLMIGLPMTWLYVSTLNEIGMTFKFLIIGPFISGASIGMIFLPGYTLTPEEWSVKQDRLKLVFGKSPVLNKVVWGILGVAMLVCTKMGLLDFIA